MFYLSYRLCLATDGAIDGQDDTDVAKNGVLSQFHIFRLWKFTHNMTMKNVENVRQSRPPGIKLLQICNFAVSSCSLGASMGRVCYSLGNNYWNGYFVGEGNSGEEKVGHLRSCPRRIPSIGMYDISAAVLDPMRCIRRLPNWSCATALSCLGESSRLILPRSSRASTSRGEEMRREEMRGERKEIFITFSATLSRTHECLIPNTGSSKALIYMRRYLIRVALNK